MKNLEKVAALCAASFFAFLSFDFEAGIG